MDHSPTLDRLARSDFRARFHLRPAERTYLAEKGSETIASHAADFIARRLAPAQPANDGKQTPMRGHPVFVAQHATATCCRGCLAKWHGIPQGRAMSAEEQSFATSLIMAWIAREGVARDAAPKPAPAKSAPAARQPQPRQPRLPGLP